MGGGAFRMSITAVDPASTAAAHSLAGKPAGGAAGSAFPDLRYSSVRMSSICAHERNAGIGGGGGVVAVVVVVVIVAMVVVVAVVAMVVMMDMQWWWWRWWWRRLWWWL